MVRRVIFKSDLEFIVEYDDLSQELRRAHDKSIRFKERTVPELAGKEFWLIQKYELDNLMSWSWHLRWLLNYSR